MANTHALLSPSGAHRWSTCAGSIALCDGLPDAGSEYADEGTAAHFIASECLTRGEDASLCLGAIVDVTEGARYLIGKLPTSPKHIRVSYDMVCAVQTYLDLVRQYAKGGELMVEQAVSIEHITDEAGAEGTSDAIVLHDDELIVIDLKYGYGEVSAEHNDQLIMYALGALEKFGIVQDFKKVRLVIVQPRVSKLPSEWDIPVSQLLERSVELRAAAKKAMLVLQKKQSGGTVFIGDLQPGEKQCQWCRALAICPAKAQSIRDTIGAEFENIAAAKDVKLVAPAFDLSELSTKMKAISAIEDWCKAVRAKVESELLAGRAVPDFKLVQGRKGARAWVDEEEVEKFMKDSLRLKQDEMYTFKIISPTKAEELLAAASPKRWKKLAERVVQPDGKPSVAPVSDKRPALVIAPVAEAFHDEDGGDLV